MDVKVYNSLLRGYTQRQDLTRASTVLQSMHLAGVAPNTESFRLLLEGAARKGACGAAERYKARLLKAGFRMDQPCWTAFLTAYAPSGKAARQIAAWKSMVAAGLKPSLDSYSSLLTCCVNFLRSEQGGGRASSTPTVPNRKAVHAAGAAGLLANFASLNETREHRSAKDSRRRDSLYGTPGSSLVKQLRAPTSSSALHGRCSSLAGSMDTASLSMHQNSIVTFCLEQLLAIPLKVVKHEVHVAPLISSCYSVTCACSSLHLLLRPFVPSLPAFWRASPLQ